MNITAIQTLAVTLITIIGVIVLIALNKVTTGAGLPIIVALAGVHLGATITTPTTTTATTTPPIQ